MLKEVTCLCGWVARGTDDEVVEQLTRHAWEDHGVRKTREESSRARCRRPRRCLRSLIDGPSSGSPLRSPTSRGRRTSSRSRSRRCSSQARPRSASPAPIHARPFGWGGRPTDSPAISISAAARSVRAPSAVVHSTSWRLEDARVVLTYIVVVEPPTL